MKIEYRKIIFLNLFLMWFILPPVSFAAKYGVDSGKYGADFLSIGVGARALALGGAAVALPGDATWTYWNPAATFQIERGAISLMHAERFSRFEMYNFASFVSAMGSLGNIGVSWIRLGIDNIHVCI